MKKLFLDTNIWLRFFLRDNEQAKDCSELLNHVELGNLTPYISSIILLEINYVLTFTYKYPGSKSYKYLEGILKTRGLTVIEKTNSANAMKNYKSHKIKFTDCLIASQIPKDMVLITYDQEFKKIPGLSVQTPAQILEKIASKET